MPRAGSSGISHVLNFGPSLSGITALSVSPLEPREKLAHALGPFVHPSIHSFSTEDLLYASSVPGCRDSSVLTIKLGMC